MNNDQATSQFLTRLKVLAANMTHAELAARLGVSRALMRNWLYRDKPSRWAVKGLAKALNRLYERHRK